ncbi:MAG: hypothetical protein KDB27_07350 [Planctomycetales bacterium]|nr:hypothetical protein [Planctomycetales bacterium]
MQISSTVASESRDEFLNLLVAQLRNQDPLEPVKQENFLAQLAQFSTLEGVEKLNANFESQLALQRETLEMQQMSQAAGLIGKEVNFVNSLHQPSQGVVDSVQISSDGLRFVIGTEIVKSEDVTAIGRTVSTSETSDISQPASQSETITTTKSSTRNADDSTADVRTSPSVA